MENGTYYSNVCVHVDDIRQSLPTQIYKTATADHRRTERNSLQNQRLRRIAMSALQSPPYTYDEDLVGWMGQQIAYLKAGQLEKMDMENFLEEVEGVVKTEKRCMKSHFIVLVTHLLKWHYQPSFRCRSWSSSIRNARLEILGVVEDSPSMKRQMQGVFEDSWKRARDLALEESGLPGNDMPKICPWDLDYAMNQKIEIR